MWKFLIAAVSILTGRVAYAAPCEDLSKLALSNTAIVMVQTVAAGQFTTPATGAQNSDFRDLPAFCRVAATVRPSADSDIRIEVWLPISSWNGKFQGVGNGGYAGAINPGPLANALRRGYAAAQTDTGHAGDGRDAGFAFGHREKLIDFGHRAVHEMTVKAKAIMKAFYDSDPKLSYWVGCSTGGRQALAEAQMYPDDYDGIVAGAPGNNTAQLALHALAIAQASHTSEASYIPPSLYSFIHKVVLEVCDGLDGVKDGVLENPKTCKFDPQVLECRSGADRSNCLTPVQVETARTIYDPSRNPHIRQPLSLGLAPGSELGWSTMAGPEPFFYADQFWKYMVFGDPKWDYKTLNAERDMPRAADEARSRGDAADPNLKPFFSRGGKLLQYHGWSDQNIPPDNSINYYNRVLETVGRPTATDGYRLFMVPGMAHCGGGEGPNTFDMLGALEQWREHGKPPDQIIGSRVTNGRVERTRPLCPYPQVAGYKGSGSTDEAANFVCKAP